jgi:hypothetical protein
MSSLFTYKLQDYSTSQQEFEDILEFQLYDGQRHSTEYLYQGMILSQKCQDVKLAMCPCPITITNV